jgi:hypothetical protein
VRTARPIVIILFMNSTISQQLQLFLQIVISVNIFGLYYEQIWPMNTPVTVWLNFMQRISKKYRRKQ